MKASPDTSPSVSGRVVWCGWLVDMHPHVDGLGWEHSCHARQLLLLLGSLSWAGHRSGVEGHQADGLRLCGLLGNGLCGLVSTPAAAVTCLLIWHAPDGSPAPSPSQLLPSLLSQPRAECLIRRSCRLPACRLPCHSLRCCSQYDPPGNLAGATQYSTNVMRTACQTATRDDWCATCTAGTSPVCSTCISRATYAGGPVDKISLDATTKKVRPAPSYPAIQPLQGPASPLPCLAQPCAGRCISSSAGRCPIFPCLTCCHPRSLPLDAVRQQVPLRQRQLRQLRAVHLQWRLLALQRRLGQEPCWAVPAARLPQAIRHRLHRLHRHRLHRVRLRFQAQPCAHWLHPPVQAPAALAARAVAPAFPPFVSIFLPLCFLPQITPASHQPLLVAAHVMSMPTGVRSQPFDSSLQCPCLFSPLPCLLFRSWSLHHPPSPSPSNSSCRLDSFQSQLQNCVPPSSTQLLSEPSLPSVTRTCSAPLHLFLILFLPCGTTELAGHQPSSTTANVNWTRYTGPLQGSTMILADAGADSMWGCSNIQGTR